MDTLPLAKECPRPQFKRLLLCWALAALLLITLFSPLTTAFWEVIDIAFFKCINGTLRDSPRWQLFWALANHKLADWVEDICVLGFFIAYVKQGIKGLRLRRVAELLFCVLYIALIIYCVNKTLFREHLDIPRLSPTLVVDNSVHLSDHISWLKIKDDSYKSFPGDHGTTALLFAASFTYFAGWRLGLLASLYAAFLCMPRLITGAHWLSDVLVGSGAITLFFLSIAFCTPLSRVCIDALECFLKAIGKAFSQLFCPK